jgi:hypothetical protein
LPKLTPHANAALSQPIQLTESCHQHIEMSSGYEYESRHFAECVRRNQQQLGSELKAQYDFIICGSGSSGSVVARRLAENADVSGRCGGRRPG